MHKIKIIFNSNFLINIFILFNFISNIVKINYFLFKNYSRNNTINRYF